MCGIYGIWNQEGTVDPRALQRAATAIRHRGPDDEGYLLVDSAGDRILVARGDETHAAIQAPYVGMVEPAGFDLGFAFRRLSIVDLTPAGHQPMASADGRYWIVYNGEIYNYVELRRDLAGRGHRFRSETDTEVVLAAFHEWGPGCLHRFNGMWAFAIWDSATRRLFVARDRFGVKPLHYVYEGGRFAFASEIKAFRAAGDVSDTPDDRAVYEYLADGRLPDPGEGATFFRDVRSLPPGHYGEVAAGTLRVTQYYALPTEGDAGEDFDGQAVAQEYAELLADAVRLRLRSDVPVGSCLSGGVDSSSIVCLANRELLASGVQSQQLGDRQKTFSAVYHTEGRYNERAYIEKVIAATGAESNYVFPTADRLAAELPKLVWHQDEPFGSTSIFAQWCVMSLARERGVTVLLDGQGADETLAGYRPYEIQVADLLRQGRLRQALSASHAAHRTATIPLAALLARSVARRLPDRHLTYFRRSRTRLGARVLRPEFAASHGDAPAPRPVNDDLHAHLRELITTSSLPHLLRYEDRNSMAFHVEGRVPFLDYRLVEFSLRRAFRWSIRDGWTKWPLRESMRPHVPDEILWRRDKVGFETPERDWLTSLLARPGYDFSDDSPVGRYLDLPAARREVAGWRANGGDARRIWRWLNVDLWLRPSA